MKIIESFKTLPLRARQLLSLGIIFALTIALPLFVWAILTQRFDVRKRAAPAESTLPANVYENEFMRIWDTRVFPGIIDLFYRNPSDGSWHQYNNIVPIAKVNNSWANAELDRSTIETSLLSDTNGTKLVKYQFSKLSNGAHFYLVMELAPGQKTVKFTAYPNEDSAPLEAFSLGNYFGYAELVRYLTINNQTLDALSYARPAGGNYQLGDFYNLPAPSDNTVKFWGEGGIIQKQSVDTPLTEQDVLMAEVRYTPWLPSQAPPGKNWFETVHITREPFTPSKAVWHFGWEESITPVPSPTLSPSPTSMCTRNQMTLAVSPPSQSGIPGQRLRYQVNVTNRDTPGCGPTRVNLGASVPSNWTATFSTQAFDLAPNHTYSAHLDITSASQNYFLGPQPIRVNVITTSLLHSVSSEVVYVLSSVASPSPTPSPTSLRWYQILKFRIKFGGVEGDSADGAKVRIRFTKLASGFDYQTPPVDVAYAGNGVYETIIALVGQNPIIPVVDGYTIFVKGEKHLARKFCYQTGQSSRCLGNGYIYIGATNIPSTQTFDFSGLPLEPGDLAIQDGVADINDFGKIRALLSKTCSQLSVEEKATADLDYSGCVNIRDAFLMRKTLEAKYDEY
jgi:hypothetical protein